MESEFARRCLFLSNVTSTGEMQTLLDVHVQTSQMKQQRLAGSGFPKKKKTRFKGRKCTLQFISSSHFCKASWAQIFVIPPVKGSMEKTPPPRIGEYHGPFLIHRTWGWVAIYFHYGIHVSATSSSSSTMSAS